MLRHRVLTQAMLCIIRGLVKDYPRPCARSFACARILSGIILGDYQKLPGIIPLCARGARMRAQGISRCGIPVKTHIWLIDGITDVSLGSMSLLSLMMLMLPIKPQQLII